MNLKKVIHWLILRDRMEKVFMFQGLLQWNLYKADTIGAKTCVRFIGMSAL